MTDERDACACSHGMWHHMGYDDECLARDCRCEGWHAGGDS